VDAIVCVFVLLDLLGTNGDITRGRVDVSDEEAVRSATRFRVDCLVKWLETVPIDLDSCATCRGATNWRVESDYGVLVVLESAVRVLLVNDALIRELLVVEADLNGTVAGIVHFLVRDN